MPEALPSGAYRPGAPLAANATAVPAEGAGLKLIGPTEEVAIAKVKGLEPRVGDEARRGLEIAARGGTTERERESVLPLQEATLEERALASPRRGHPVRLIQEPTRPSEARKADAAGTIDRPTRHLAARNSSKLSDMDHRHNHIPLQTSSCSS